MTRMSTWSADAGRRGALAGQRRLRLAQRDPGDVHAVLARGVDRERAPAAADVEHPLARLQAELRADELELGPLRLLERRRAARPDRARVRHRLVQEQREVLVGEVVVVRDRALVAQDRVARALRAQLHLRHLRDVPQRARLDRRERDLGLRARSRSAAATSCAISASASSMSSTSMPPLTYARPRPSWPGARSTWPSASGEVMLEGRAAVAVGRRQRACRPTARA